MADRAVDRRETSRLVLSPGRTRRTREKVVIAYCGLGWLANPGFPREQACQSVFDLDRETYWALHEGVHVTWRVERWKGRKGLRSHYCDVHLPEELRQLHRAGQARP